MIKPKIAKMTKVAIVSILVMTLNYSSRYNNWIKQLKEQFWVEIIEMENAKRSWLCL